MAFRATNITPEQGFNRAKSLASGLKRYASSLSSSWSAGADSEAILDALKTLIGYSNSFVGIKSIPGISDYARSIAAENDPTYDVAAEFNTMIAAVDAAVSSIISTFPTDGSGFLLAESLDSNGARVPRAFSDTALASVRADLDAVAASIS